MVQKDSILGFGWQCGLGEVIKEKIREEAEKSEPWLPCELQEFGLYFD